MTALARRETWGELGPAMRGLPNDRWRAFVRAYVQNPNPRIGGGKAAALRAAGLGENSTAEIQAKRAWDLAQDDRIVAAIAEEARKVIRGGAPEAVSVLYDILGDKNVGAGDRLRAVNMVLARVDPEVSKTDLQVTHKIISRDQEEIEEYRAAIAIGATREKLMELFGENRLPAIERIDAEDRAKRAKVIDIDAEPVEVPRLVEIPRVVKPAPVKPARRAVAPEPAVDPDILEDL